MSIEQYQRAVNTFDKDIVSLEKKKAAFDKKEAEEKRKAENISIGKNTSPTIIKSRLKKKSDHLNTANKAALESAKMAEKIADKQKKRNEAELRLQKEQNRFQKASEKEAKQIQKAYERKIEELQAMAVSEAALLSNENGNTLPEYDVFISHAWEDKVSFVDEFVEELRALGVSVWYDTSEIRWGDSMRKRIDDGLKKSRFGIAVLSPDYIREGKYWTKAELDGLFQLDSINGKTLLPIWHNLNKKEVLEYSPIIASRLALSTATMTAREIANNLLSILSESKEN